MPSKCNKCGSTENYNFELNVGLCNPCIGIELGRIEELERPLRAAGFKIEGMLAVGNELGKQDMKIKILEAENKKMKEMKCPPILDGDTCICPIEELETVLIKKDERIEELESAIKDVCDLINEKATVSKWKIFNWLDKALKG